MWLKLAIAKRSSSICSISDSSHTSRTDSGPLVTNRTLYVHIFIIWLAWLYMRSRVRNGEVSLTHSFHLCDSTVVSVNRDVLCHVIEWPRVRIEPATGLRWRWMVSFNVFASRWEDRSSGFHTSWGDSPITNHGQSVRLFWTSLHGEIKTGWTITSSCVVWVLTHWGSSFNLWYWLFRVLLHVVQKFLSFLFFFVPFNYVEATFCIL